jgi:hypothetical protein
MQFWILFRAFTVGVLVIMIMTESKPKSRLAIRPTWSQDETPKGTDRYRGIPSHGNIAIRELPNWLVTCHGALPIIPTDETFNTQLGLGDRVDVVS